MKAMILAAGRGERMRPLTDDLPKPLLKAGGKSLIEWHLEKLARAGCREIVINHSHLGHRIESTLGDGSQWKVHIYYSREPEALGTAGGIANALGWLGAEPFAVVNGDVYTDYNFELLVSRLQHFVAGDFHAHLIMVNNPPHHPSGDFALANGRITLDDGNNLTYSGIALFKPEMFQGIARGSSKKLAPLLEQLIRRGLVSGELFQGNWVDVGTPARLKELDEQLGSKIVRK